MAEQLVPTSMSANAIRNTITNMKPLLVASLFMSTLSASCQVHWSQSSDWALYQYEGDHLLTFPIDSLRLCKSYSINRDSMAYFINSAVPLNSKAPLAWMGGYAATCKINGIIRKVDISSYGGYFYDEKTSAYYQMPIEKIDAWLAFVQNSYLTMIKK
jgi:hypothetical protein